MHFLKQAIEDHGQRGSDEIDVTFEVLVKSTALYFKDLKWKELCDRVAR